MTVAIATLFGLGSLWGQAQKNWKDRAEYDLVASIDKEADASKKLDLLQTWKTKYPETDFKLERLQRFLAAYQALNRGADMYATAKEMVALDPNNLQALYWITILTQTLANTAPDALDTGEKAAKGLLSGLDEAFAPAKKPATTSEDAWKKERLTLESVGHSTSGWVEMARKNNEVAEGHFIESLKDNPNNAQVSYWLAGVIVAQKKVEKYSAALFHYARAATYEGPGSLPAPERAKVAAFLEKTYVTYHGDKSGLDELRASTKSSALPAADLKILTAAEREQQSEEELRKSNPMLALWTRIKKELVGEGGEQYWESSMKGAGLPGGVDGVNKFKGKLVSHTPAKNPKEVVVGIAEHTIGDVTLKLDEPLLGAAEPGTEIEFEGVATAYTKEPFMVTFDVEKAQVSGWPAPKKAPAAKKALKKKK